MATTGAKYATTYLWRQTYWYDIGRITDSNYTNYADTELTSAASGYAMLAGFDFSSIPTNAVITGYTLILHGGAYSAKPIKGTTIAFQLAGDPVDYSGAVRNSGDYTQVGSKIYFVNAEKIGNTSLRDYTHTSDSNDTSAISWMNSNIGKIRNGSFGVLIDCVVAKVCYVTIDITYTTPSTITTAVSPTGAGTVTGGGAYADGSSVTLTASPSTGYHFVQWQDGNTSASRTITVSGDATYIANFKFTNKIYKGTSQISNIYIGSTPIKSIYIGTSKVFDNTT